LGVRASTLIPRHVLFGGEDRSALQISGDGSRIGFIAPHDDAPNVWIGETGSDAYRPVTTAGGRGIGEFHWSGDSRLIIYAQDRGGDENWRLYATEVDTGETLDLTPFDGVQAQVLAVSADHPGIIVVALNLDDRARHDVYRLELATGRLEAAARNEGFSRWIVDHDLEVRGAVRPRADGGGELLVRDDEDSPWRTALSVDIDDAAEIVFDAHPIRFSLDGRSLYLICSKDAETSRLARLSLQTGELETLAADPDYDVLDVWFHPRSKEPQAAFITRERSEYLACDPVMSTDLAALKVVNDGDVQLLSRDDADRRWIVAFASDVDPGSYYLYDRSTRKARVIFERHPSLREFSLARSEPFSFTARDGLEIHGYLTFPADGGRSRLPTVVKVHGGPEYRDRWTYDPWVQLFAGRGYLCVQVNFRASIGYGRRFLAAGRKQWGRAMHTDVVDAIAFVIDQGYADPDRVAMWGTSYGGYETLWCAATEPELLTCAVAGMAPVNLLTFIRGFPAYWVHVRAQYLHRLGDPSTEEEMLRERSPLAHARNIRRPLLLYYGENDPRVPLSEAEQLAAELEAGGVQHELMVLRDEGHFVGALSPAALADVAARTEAFLARHLGGRAEE
jgi:dipeptidyl aminopeptidase/acylaminoacyl peptidase